MKIIKSIYLIVVGGILILFPPISYFNIGSIVRSGTYYNVTEYENYITHGSQGAETTIVYETSIAFVVIGVLTVLYGIFTLWEVYNEKTKSSR